MLPLVPVGVHRDQRRVFFDQELTSEKVALAAAEDALKQTAERTGVIQLGAHVQGANPKLDASIRARNSIMTYLRQEPRLHVPMTETLAGLQSVAGQLG